ncbi:MAG: methionyl-tRNA formyltransferase [OM182 bacterium]|nr:methionyl-tRNA formyltransferase [OM182 bacterium]MDP4871443.1 methionyl-tRNA formyltransferase [Gammaproteobacteria bacterium]
MNKLRVCFAGTPEFAAAHLNALIAAQAEDASRFELVAVYTQPDRPAGRGKKLSPSPVKRTAMEAGLRILQPSTLRSDEAVAELNALACDVLIVVAYGLILPQSILDTPRLGCVNVHASLLPRWRGAAPIERALLAGDDSTGVTIMQMDAGLDTGAMLEKAAVVIDGRETRVSLEAKLVTVGTKSLVAVMNNLEAFQDSAQVQDDALSTYANKIDKAESLIDWTLPAAKIDLLVRASIGRAPAFALLNGERARILESTVLDTRASAEVGTVTAVDKSGFSVCCGGGSVLQISRVQMPGKGDVSVSQLLNGKPDAFAVNTCFDKPTTDEGS